MGAARENSAQGPEVRLVRSLLPAFLVREVDEIVLRGVGGYLTREEFIRDAITNHVLEVKHGADGRTGTPVVVLPTPESATITDAQPGSRARLHEQRGRETDENAQLALPVQTAPPEALANTTGLVPITTFEGTALIAPESVTATIVDGLAHCAHEPMLGLHNRDYPSIWAARLLAEQTVDGPVDVERFFATAAWEAWRYAYRLRALEEGAETKVTALFPTNVAKPGSAEKGFLSFAIGDLARRPSDGGTIKATGPLFLWNVCQVQRQGEALLLGLTPTGAELVQLLDGLTLGQPHDRQHSERFFEFLRAHAPWDWDGFVVILESVSSTPTREQLARDVHAWHPDWTEPRVNTNAAGYIARAREWGLIEPKLTDGRYRLTDFGATVKSEVGS